MTLNVSLDSTLVSPFKLIDTVLRRLELSALFEVTVSSEEVARGKPAPDVYLEAARRLGVDPARCAAPPLARPTIAAAAVPAVARRTAGNEYMSSGLSECASDSPADAERSPGDDRNFAFQLSHWYIIFSWRDR